ncbi:MAG: YajQ family cyclic di-GMP-binding protein [Myxococcaceae bacterium]|nr:YajQ family cyclic di-GMP-binding protein [Myxococcaceae bacterium]MCI0672129.1 YajQ family cyclic di-GMP-binding protein [Myxococcaceae bacterium]
MPSFDVVSKLNLQELDNAVQQTRKELLNRYDFQGTNTELTLGDDKKSILIRTRDEQRAEAVQQVLLAKLAKRGVSLRSLEIGKLEPTGLGMVKQTLSLQQGIPVEKAKELIRFLKDSKLKAQASIQGEEMRVTGKNRDDLQEAIALFKSKQDEVKLDLQFTNFRD